METTPTAAEIERCAAFLRSGDVVAFPTETVYGLGADAFNRAAIERVFELKGRPRTSPLIVHVADVEAARRLAATWPAGAEALAARYWPGPLTLIVAKAPAVPDLVTAGLGTVGLRVPAHPVARALLRAAGIPVAAPSANPFTRLSATRAEHVRAAFGQRLAAILDAGPTPVGIESTVVSFAGGTPRLLRPGAISLTELRDIVPGVTLDDGAVSESAPHESPGQSRRHYSPRTPLLIATSDEHLPEGKGAWMHHTRARRPTSSVRDVAMPTDPASYAAALYATLHDLDAEDLAWIAIESIPDGEEWAAIRDRLRRAAAR